MRNQQQDGKRLEKQTAKSKQGFTLFELLVAVAMVGILVAIVGPSWINWRDTQLLTAAQDQALQALRQAQAKAITSKLEWRVSFREVEQAVQWAIHPSTTAPTTSDWQSLPEGVQLDRTETTLARSGEVYRVVFTYRGHVNPPLGRITFMAAGGNRVRRCVVVSTILGTMRKARNNRVADEGGRYCY